MQILESLCDAVRHAVLDEPLKAKRANLMARRRILQLKERGKKDG